MNALQLIRQFLSEHYGIPPENITPEAAVEEVGIDSLVQLELIFEFEAKFGSSITQQDVPKLQTVSDLITLADNLRNRGK